VHTYIIINASYEEICIEFQRKNNTTLNSLHLNCPQVLNIFYHWPVKYYCGQFGYLWLWDYRIKFSCPYIPQGLYFL